MENRLKPLLLDLLGEQITAYKLSKQTGVSFHTAASALDDPTYFPSPKVAEAICRTFNIQPGHFLFYRAPGEKG